MQCRRKEPVCSPAAVPTWLPETGPAAAAARTERLLQKAFAIPSVLWQGFFLGGGGSVRSKRDQLVGTLGVGEDGKNGSPSNRIWINVSGGYTTNEGALLVVRGFSFSELPALY